MKKQRIFKFLLSCTLILSLLFYAATTTNYRYSKVLANNNIVEKAKTDSISEQQAINKYISGNKSDVIEKINGYDVLKVGNKKIIILGDNLNFDGKVSPLIINNSHDRYDVKYIGERTKPAIDISDTHCNNSNKPLSVDFSISKTIEYKVEGSFGIGFEHFKAKLGGSISETFTSSATRRETIPAKRCGTLKGIPKYDVYEYQGWIRTATLYAPKGFIYFLSLNPEE